MSANARVLGQSADNLNHVDAAFDLVFMDPPYGENLIQNSLRSLKSNGWVTPDSLIVAELDAKESLPDLLDFKLLQDRKWGRNRFLFLELE